MLILFEILNSITFVLSIHRQTCSGMIIDMYVVLDVVDYRIGMLFLISIRYVNILHCITKTYRFVFYDCLTK